MKSEPKTERNIEIIQRHYLKGESFKSISKDFDVSYSTITGLAASWRKRLLLSATKGEDMQAVAHSFGFPVSVLWDIVDMEERRERASRAYWKEREDELHANNEAIEFEYHSALAHDIFLTFRQGISAAEIARKNDMDREAVLRAVERHLSSIISTSEKADF